jgi:hypothetical protein
MGSLQHDFSESVLNTQETERYKVECLVPWHCMPSYCKPDTETIANVMNNQGRQPTRKQFTNFLSLCPRSTLVKHMWGHGATVIVFYTLVLDEGDKSAPCSNQFPPGGRRLGGPLGWLKHNNEGKNT